MRAERFELVSEAAVYELAAVIRALAPPPGDVREVVSEIIRDVRERGDEAVVELTRRFDSERADVRFRVGAEELREAVERLDGGVREGLEVAIRNVRLVAEADIARTVAVELPEGQSVRLRELPVRRVGAYVPGGRAAYPSSVVMCCVPARVAGVEEVAVSTPPGPRGVADATILAACGLCEVDEVYVMGGAQAVGALAFGTKTVRAVDVIVGPGSHYVQEAKRQVAGWVGIDGIAGPSELVVIADQSADPALVALDLAAQSEHGPDTLLALLSPEAALIEAVEQRLPALESRFDTISAAPVALVKVPTVEAAIALSNEIAPEHLELTWDEAEDVLAQVTAAGCVFLGRCGGAAFGDYAAGSNHVLPTGGAARFAGPLGTATFRRRQSLVSLPEEAARRLAPHVGSVARAEGFPVHAASAEARAAGPADGRT